MELTRRLILLGVETFRAYHFQAVMEGRKLQTRENFSLDIMY